MRIVYCINSLGIYGGIERTTVMKANALSLLPDNKIWILCLRDGGTSVYRLLPSVKVIDIGVSYSMSKKGPSSLIGLFKGKRQHKKRLHSLLSQICPDVVVSTDNLERSFLATIPGHWVSVREIHEIPYFRIKKSETLYEKLIATISTYFDYYLACKRYDQVVLLSDFAKEMSPWDNACVIPNPVSFCGVESNLDAPRIVTIGRLSKEKNFSALIRAFQIVARRFPDWHLDIFGEGDQRQMLSRLICDMNLSKNVHLHNGERDVQKVLLSASIYAQSSVFESFGIALVEAMGCGLPVVSFDCPIGPKSIIQDGVDGFLVALEDERSLADKICLLIENVSLRKQMGANAIKKAKLFEINRIVSLWMMLFVKLVSDKTEKPFSNNA